MHHYQIAGWPNFTGDARFRDVLFFGQVYPFDYATACSNFDYVLNSSFYRGDAQTILLDIEPMEDFLTPTGGDAALADWLPDFDAMQRAILSLIDYMRSRTALRIGGYGLPYCAGYMKSYWAMVYHKFFTAVQVYDDAFFRCTTAGGAETWRGLYDALDFLVPSFYVASATAKNAATPPPADWMPRFFELARRSNKPLMPIVWSRLGPIPYANTMPAGSMAELCAVIASQGVSELLWWRDGVEQIVTDADRATMEAGIQAAG